MSTHHKQPPFALRHLGLVRVGVRVGVRVRVGVSVRVRVRVRAGVKVRLDWLARGVPHGG
jgi:hypothetical protein